MKKNFLLISFLMMGVVYSYAFNLEKSIENKAFFDISFIKNQTQKIETIYPKNYKINKFNLSFAKIIRNKTTYLEPKILPVYGSVFSTQKALAETLKK